MAQEERPLVFFPNTIFHAQGMDGEAMCGGLRVFDWSIINCPECRTKLKEFRDERDSRKEKSNVEEKEPSRETRARFRFTVKVDSNKRLRSMVGREDRDIRMWCLWKEEVNDMAEAEVPTEKCRVNLIGLNNYQASLEVKKEEAIQIINLFMEMQRRVMIPLDDGWVMAFNFENIISITMTVLEE